MASSPLIENTDPMDLGAEQLHRSDEIWFDDGNLILQAENTIFRIYRGHLSARSSVFSDMFGFPPPPEGNHTMDGCPIVQVYDSAQDMTYFLKAVLFSEFFEPPPSPTTLDIVGSVLRLATKYDVRYLRIRALNHLVSTYPTTLAGWKNRDSTRTIPSIENTPFAALNLATEFDLPWLVPSIVYCICSHDLAKTLDGCDWQGGRVELSWADKRLCINARNKLLLVQNAHALSIVKHARAPPNPAANPDEDDASPKCTSTTGDGCHQIRLRCADILTRWGTAGFLDFFDEQYDAFASSFCKVCLDAFREKQEGAVQEMWSRLPRMMDLPGWEELERLRGLAMA
ncbi:hypothetical protein CC1G_12279 [Coprinopsis cinerea okayama7|uniref:BTB domain-containing protein n=1 Tax=Coprinopsis cinerea (strain Okayama-7 / 130 / ATCC MYA-4618 / FGSC 9003) TaxID=240176 RepID=A8MZR9_COPC7|nr:hypothetical protein CC1G_12279 [Coprinopsis cinerea okayama7\|eukprot:XP_001828131.1 hypothetical protein CC1G_12279 [Coprinopsis cinerea okayama7\